MNNAADPRVNPHHYEHVHDWHGDYDDGRYLGDMCRCGATRTGDAGQTWEEQR